ncbi:PRC-barrel domain-containing protein [Bacillus testis]|uniref:PRC-barrel domain-containing protein n=1 Tax=Bacillus testis TaxID=1622072 RepID=UPI00067F2EFC|nr:YlmC/YmxH family sporulation protein [Bacillus testis]
MGKISEIQLKDIINLLDGKRLGTLQDLVIDTQTGQIEALIVATNGKWLNLFHRDDEVIIPWRKIKKIGKDIIFVDYSNPNAELKSDEEKPR